MFYVVIKHSSMIFYCIIMFVLESLHTVQVEGRPVFTTPVNVASTLFYVCIKQNLFFDNYKLGRRYPAVNFSNQNAVA